MNDVNLFFSCDNAYFPFLSVTLGSLKENCDPTRDYAVRILHTGLRRDYMQRLHEAFHERWFRIEYIDVSSAVAQITRQLHTRDYYSKSTYYRMFIPNLFPQLNKALYLDSDLLVRGNIAELYDTDLGENLVGAVSDGIINTIDDLRLYALNRLKMDCCEHYFNAGVLLMNLDALRRIDFERIFLDLLQTVTFQVAQDQDYLNVICKGRVTYLDLCWNTMPMGEPVWNPKLIHYNLDCKPWHRDGVLYGELFWDYAIQSPFYREIRQARERFSDDDVAQAARQTMDLIAMGRQQALAEEENNAIQGMIAQVVHI